MSDFTAYFLDGPERGHMVPMSQPREKIIGHIYDDAGVVTSTCREVIYWLLIVDARTCYYQITWPTPACGNFERLAPWIGPRNGAP